MTSSPSKGPLGSDPERKAKAKMHTSKIELALAGGHFDRAAELFRQAVFDIAAVGGEQLAGKTLPEIGVPTRICNVLETKFDVLFVEDLENVKSSLLLSTPDFGYGMLDALWQAVLKAALKGVG